MTLSHKWTKETSETFDEKTASASDYTVFIRLDPDQNKVFTEHYYRPDKINEVSRGQQMREWIWHQLALIRNDERI